MLVIENTTVIFKKRFKSYVLSPLRIVTPVSFLKVKIYVIMIREYFNPLYIQKQKKMEQRGSIRLTLVFFCVPLVTSGGCSVTTHHLGY